MTSRALLYYISGHGFGHARRCAETIRVLAARRPGMPIHVRTLAEPAIFRDLPVRFEPTPIDCGAVEIDALNINWPATLDHVRQSLAGRASFVAAEARYIREQGIGLIVADIPFLAGYVAEAAQVPCWGQCNFMWDWIYQPHTDDAELLRAIAGGYQRMTGLLRLPFPHECHHFREVVDVPLIASPLTLAPAVARQRLGIGPGEVRPIILIAMRGGTSPQILDNLRRLDGEYLFITPQGPLFPVTDSPPASLPFWDAMQVASAVVSKPGHGIVTDCASMGVGLLYPARNGFREDAMILREAVRYFRQREIPLADFDSGNWRPHLDGLLREPRPAPAASTHGANFVADFILSRLP